MTTINKTEAPTSATKIPLNVRRLIKRLGDEADSITDAELAEAWKVFEDERESLDLFKTVLILGTHPRYVPKTIKFVTNRSLEAYEADFQREFLNWCHQIGQKLTVDQFRQIVDYGLVFLLQAENPNADNPDLRWLVDRLLAWSQQAPEESLLYLTSYLGIFDLFVTACTDEDAKELVGICLQSGEENILKFLRMLAEQHQNDRSRGWDQPTHPLRQLKPWLRFLRAFWSADDKQLPIIARCFILTWRNADVEATGIVDFMLSLIASSAEPLKSTIKAALYSFATPAGVQFARSTSQPIFDPIVCFVVVFSAVPDEIYGAAKWAIQFGDETRFVELADVVTAVTISSRESVLRRFPPFFLLVHEFYDRWTARETPIAVVNATNALVKLAKLWAQHRAQMEREADAEQQSHYFSSNAELIDKKLGQFLVLNAAKI